MVNLSIELPKDFLNEEVRWGYPISHEMKKVWAVELDLLQQLINICDKYNLKYCLSGGSMLGAVRHKGFIPWDDDIDVYMLRSDYEELMKHGDEFKQPYFLQTTYTDKYRYCSFAKIRNCETTAILFTNKFTLGNQGIFVDIFPIDGVEFGTQAAKEQHDAWAAYKAARFGFDAYMDAMCTQYVLNPIVWFRARWNRIKFAKEFEKKADYMRMFEKVATMRNLPTTELWGDRTLRFDDPEMVAPKSDWEDLIEVPFEFLTVKIPRSYDKLLRYQFGDYMTPQKVSGFHSGFYALDADHPYQYYQEKIKKESYKQAWSNIFNPIRRLFKGKGKV